MWVWPRVPTCIILIYLLDIFNLFLSKTTGPYERKLKMIVCFFFVNWKSEMALATGQSFNKGLYEKRESQSFTECRFIKLLLF